MVQCAIRPPGNLEDCSTLIASRHWRDTWSSFRQEWRVAHHVGCGREARRLDTSKSAGSSGMASFPPSRSLRGVP